MAVKRTSRRPHPSRRRTSRQPTRNPKRRGSNKDLQRLVDAALAQGWRVDATQAGHLVFRSPDRTKPLVHVSGTPSDHRAFQNIRSDLRRAGLAVNAWLTRNEFDIAREIANALVAGEQRAGRRAAAFIGSAADPRGSLRDVMKHVPRSAKRRAAVEIEQGFTEVANLRQQLWGTLVRGIHEMEENPVDPHSWEGVIEDELRIADQALVRARGHVDQRWAGAARTELARAADALEHIVSLGGYTTEDQRRQWRALAAEYGDVAEIARRVGSEEAYREFAQGRR